MAEDKKERQICTVYARCVGWITPVHNFNIGKRAEYDDRKEYNLEQIENI